MEEVERHIRSLPDEELVQMVRVEFEEYTDEALAIGQDEMRKRGMPDEGECIGDEAPCSVSADAGNLEIMLRSELQYQECYGSILDFVMSMSIRSGEYEGTSTVIRKMDRENFILYSETVNREAGRVILGCVAVRKAELVGWIDKIGGENGFEVEDDDDNDDETGD